MIKLNESPVRYSESVHKYYLNDRELSGITKLIKSKVCPDEYDGVDDATLDRAKLHGHAVHTAVEMFIKFGVETEIDEMRAFRVEQELSEAVRTPIASEYIVSDEKFFASGIDIVSKASETSVYLVDIKTTSTHNVEYVTWQLSVYKYLFELQNPDIRVEGIFALWLRGDRHSCQRLTPHSNNEVEALLYEDNFMPSEARKTSISVALDIQNQVKQYKMAMDEAKMQYEALSRGLEQLMVENGVKKFEGEIISITKRSDSVRRTFDAKSFERDHPELYAKYVKESKTKGGINIYIKE